MRSYLTAVYKTIYSSEPSSVSHIPASPEELAEATTLQCFADADTDRDGYLTLEVREHVLFSYRHTSRCVLIDVLAPCGWQEFTAWYSNFSTDSGAANGAVADAVVTLAAAPPDWVSMAEIKRITGLSS